MPMRVSGDTSRAGDPHSATDQLDPGDDDDDYDYDDDDVVYYEESTGWRWVAGVAGAVLVLAVIGTFVILRGGDTATTTGRIQPSAPAPVPARPSATTPQPVATTPSTSAPVETVTTVTPTATTPAGAAPPPTPDVDQRTITYIISGTRQPGDFVTVTYIDGTDAANRLRRHAAVDQDRHARRRRHAAEIGDGRQSREPPQLLDHRWERASGRRPALQHHRDDLQPLSAAMPARARPSVRRACAAARRRSR